MNRCKYYKNECCTAQKGAPYVYCHGDETECETLDNIFFPETPASIFKHNLRTELKNYVKDFTRIYIVDDVLLIEFYHLGTLSITYVETSITRKMNEGVTSKELAEKIYKWYRSVILSRYFVPKS